MENVLLTENLTEFIGRGLLHNCMGQLIIENIQSEKILPEMQIVIMK